MTQPAQDSPSPSDERQWRNRIVGHSEEDPQSLLANPHNWRIHTEIQRLALDSSIDQIGFIRSVTVDQSSRLIIDGHERVYIAVDRKQATVPVEWVDLNEEEMKLALLSMDGIALMAQADQLRLRDLLMADGLSDNINLLNYLNGTLLDWGDGPRTDPEGEWQQMPEYESHDMEGFRKITIHFPDQESVEKFSNLIGQQLTDKTRGIWYPEAPVGSAWNKRYVGWPSPDTPST